jgi:ligand-binding sensor domain-containing protein
MNFASQHSARRIKPRILVVGSSNTDLIIQVAHIPKPALSPKNSSWGARVWRSEEGLPENNVTGVVQTPEGYLWVATHAGLARFDGVQFRRYPLPSDAGVRRRMIRAALLDHEKSMWLALEGGMVVSISPTATNVFTAAQGLAYGRPWVLTQDGDRAVWIGYADGTAFRIANGQVTRFDEENGLLGNGGCWLTTDGKGLLWFARGERLVYSGPGGL